MGACKRLLLSVWRDQSVQRAHTQCPQGYATVVRDTQLTRPETALLG